MRRAVFLLLLAGCPQSPGGPCQTDRDCNSEVCARNMECLPASQVRSVKTVWTIRGMPTNTTTCSSTPDLYIQFDGGAVADSFGYAPVPCVAGQFTVDKLPKRFTTVELGVQGNVHDYAVIDGSGTATFNLYP